MGDNGVIRALTPMGNTSRYKQGGTTSQPSTPKSTAAATSIQKKQRLQQLNRNLNNSNKNVGNTASVKDPANSIRTQQPKSNVTKTKENQTPRTILPRQGTFTSPSTASLGQLSKVGTFVKDDDSQPGLAIPRIDSASMSQKQVLRTGDRDQVKEANVHIVVDDSDELPKQQKEDLKSEENEPNSTPKESFKETPQTNNTITQFNENKTQIQTKPSSSSNSNKPKKSESDENNTKGEMSSTAEANISSSNNTENVIDEKGDSAKLEKSLDLQTPFKVPNKSPQKEDDKSSIRNSSTPVPAEPVLHKKSAYTSEHKKKEDMAYSGADIVKQAANAKNQPEEEKPVDDDRVERLTEMLTQMDGKLAAAEEENKQLKQRNQELESDVKQYEDAQQRTNGEIELLKTEWGELTKQLEATKAESEKLKDQMNQSGEEESERIKELSEQRANLEAEVIQMRTDMKKMLAERQKEMESHESIVASMKEDIMKQQTAFDEEKRNYEKEIQELKKQIEQLKKECSDIRQSKEYVDAENEKLKTTIKNLEKEIEALKTEIKSLEEQLKESVNKCQDLDAERKLLLESKAESEQTELELEEALKENSELKKKTAEQEKMLQKMTGDVKSIEDLDHTINSLQQQNDKFAKQINNLTEENFYLRNQTNSKDNEMENLRKRASELSEKSETGKVALSSMTELIKEKQAHIEDLQKEVKTLSDTNSNYLIAMESFSTSKRQNEDVTKAKYDDMEGAHKKLLDENKRLRTVLAHKTMAETSRDSDTAELQNLLDQKERELDLALERIAHLETLLDDVYKAREIHMMHNDYANEEEAKMSVTSLPDIRGSIDSRASYNQKYYNLKDLSKSHDNKKWANHVDNRHSNSMRQYRHAESYAKRFEHRPSKYKQIGPITKLK